MMTYPNLQPRDCNVCGGHDTVGLVDNTRIYGSKKGSGLVYYCHNCGAYVGTHVPNPTIAYGILSNKEMRYYRVECHKLFDKRWSNSRFKKNSRENAYRQLARYLDIPRELAHFGYMDLATLKKAYKWLLDKY